jgi:hypothetical protein
MDDNSARTIGELTMGEIFHALEVLNRTMDLGLSGRQLLAAEMGFKSALARVSNPDPAQRLPADPLALARGYEISATIRPRPVRLSLEQLSAFAKNTADNPLVSVDGKTMKTIEKALKGTAGGEAAGRKKRGRRAR